MIKLLEKLMWNHLSEYTYTTSKNAKWNVAHLCFFFVSFSCCTYGNIQLEALSALNEFRLMNVAILFSLKWDIFFIAKKTIGGLDGLVGNISQHQQA